jgi:hypothetical protein
MKYTVEFREDHRIVAARAEGKWDMTTDNGMVQKILKMVDAHGSSKVLLDIRELQFDLPMFQLFERVREMREQRRQFGRVSAKAAIIYSDATPKIEEDMKFFQNAAQNRGLPYRVFKDIEEAMVWLVGEPGQG